MTSGPQQYGAPRPDSGVWTAPPPGPVSFSAAAATPVPAPARRTKWRAAMVAVPALVLVAAASSIITAVAVGGHSTSGHGAQAAGAGAAHKSSAAATVGTIASTHGSTWTITTAAGKSVSVELGAKTAYGSKADPSAASAFHAGSHVKIMGSHTGSTITAKRVVLAPTKSGSAAGSGTTS